MVNIIDIYEGIFDKNNVKDVGNNLDAGVLDWVQTNYSGKFYISGTKNGKLLVSSKGNVKCKYRNIESIVNEYFEFDHIKGHFDVHDCTNITNLIGGPRIVDGDLKLQGCWRIENFDGFPEKIGGMLNLRASNIESLIGIPVADSYNLSGSEICSLEGLPEKVNGDIDCEACYSLRNLKGAPKEVGGSFRVNSCRLYTLEGAPEKVGVNFSCSHCKFLRNLEGAPKEVGQSLFCDYNDLDSLKGCPQKIGIAIWILGTTVPKSDIETYIPNGIRIHK